MAAYWVVNAGDQRIRIFGPDGVHEATFGGRGQGPGEFRYIIDIAEVGDSLRVTGMRRVTWMTLEGSVIRTEPLDWTGLTERLASTAYFGSGSPLSDGGYLLNAELRRELPLPGGIVRPPQPVFRTGPSMDGVDTLGIFPGIEQVDLGSAERPDYWVLPFARRTLVAHGGSPSIVYVAANESHDVLQFSVDGSLRRVLRPLRSSAPATRSDFDAWKTEMLALLEGRPGVAADEIEPRMDRLPVPDSLPPYQHLIVAINGSLWAGLGQPGIGRQEALDYILFSSTGTPLGHVSVPERFQLLEVGDNYVLGVSRDELDVQTLQLFELGVS